jgi:hypothetical protein
MNDSFSGLAAWLEATGPYGAVAALAWAFWRTNERKDAALRALHEAMLAMSREQTVAIMRVEAALVALREAVIRRSSVDRAE